MREERGLPWGVALNRDWSHLGGASKIPSKACPILRNVNSRPFKDLCGCWKSGTNVLHVPQCSLLTHRQ